MNLSNFGFDLYLGLLTIFCEFKKSGYIKDKLK